MPQTYSQLMSMSKAALVSERNSYTVGSKEYDRVNEHVQYAIACETFGDEMKQKGTNGPRTGLETPPPPPTP